MCTLLGRALLIGSHHYMTFDNRFVSMRTDFERNNQCFYLLAHDFFQGNFTLLLEPSVSETREHYQFGFHIIPVITGKSPT